MNTNDAWTNLIKKYNILKRVKEEGYVYIDADQIREFKEPRLMAKWDSEESLPIALKENHLNILPNSRGGYLVGDFLMFQTLPPLDEKVYKMDYVLLPEMESIDVNNITSEANAVNVLRLTNILSDFLGTDDNHATFNGRMGTGVFEFYIDTYEHGKVRVEVENAQCEIDAGFENSQSVVIIEAKNVVNKDFNIRQLYYPYRIWKEKVNKPIRLVFSVYSNMIFRLFEYRFQDPNDYSSIELVQSKNYSLQDTTISIDDLVNVKKSIVEIKRDALGDIENNKERIPFIQADSFERVISLMENLQFKPLTEQEIAGLMGFTGRQSGYYYNAGRYIGLFEKSKSNKRIQISLTEKGNKICKMNYKERQLALVKSILEHQIFYEMFERSINNGEIPNSLDIQNRMRELELCGDSLISRRASSVVSWMKWIFNLINL